MNAYLFVHFREKRTPDGEQVHFALSRDGLHWEAVNGGRPVLWAYHGKKGVRDFAVCRSRIDGRFYIVATDLSLAYGMRNEFAGSWALVGSQGSRALSVWESEDLVHWTEQRLCDVCPPEFGCAWAPDITYDEAQGDYLLHWSSTTSRDHYARHAIYYSRTRDFKTFTPAQLLYAKEDGPVIDSAMVKEGDVYYLFVKSAGNPDAVILLRSDSITGPFERVPAFDRSMEACDGPCNEAPALLRLEDGRWCMFIDYYGVPGAGQGYIPFVSEDIASGRFVRCTAARGADAGDAGAMFTFPYGFKHGSILPITPEEYERIRSHRWEED